MKPAPTQRLGPHPRAAQKPSSGFGIQDILFTLFKHKWKIVVLSLLGFVAAGGIYYKASKSPSFETRAKLLVRYVQERSALDDYESRAEAAGRRGSAVMGTEVEILQSADLMTEVAKEVRPEVILAGSEGEGTPGLGAAAARVAKGFDVAVSRGSNVIHLSYRHSDPEVAVDVLEELIKVYFMKHLEIHRATEAFQEVAKQTDQARLRLQATDDELKELRSSANVVSVAESMIALEDRRKLVAATQLATEAELAAQETRVKRLEEALGLPPMQETEPADVEESADAGESADAEEGTAEQEGSTEQELAEARRKSAEALAEYRDLAGQLEAFKSRRNQLLLTRPATDRQVRELERKIDVVEKRGLDLVELHPELSGQPTLKGQPVGPEGAVGPNIDEERAQLLALRAKSEKLDEQMGRVLADYKKLSEVGGQIMSLEEQRKMEADKYATLEKRLAEARADGLLDPSNMPNISEIQRPSAPVRSLKDSTLKLVMGVAASGVIAGIGLAFLLELLDRRVSRPMEIQTRLQLPLMMSIPYTRSKDGIAKLIGREPGLEFFGDAGDVILPPVPHHESAELAKPEGPDHFISRYAEAIRDRVMFNFEVNNITHKPKLVAVTGLSSGAGATTIAAGMAKAFAEEGRRKVLLVDLNPGSNGNGSNGFHRNPSDSLVRALEISRSESFRKSPRSFYFASAQTRREGAGSRALAPMELHQLMPSLNASDFDYIIFDMPPVDPTSPTLAMAGFMDKVLLVLDAEKTTRESLQWGYSELEKGRADVSCIYNKARSHAPRWVDGGVS